MQEFYANKSVVVVGATGAFGKLTSLALLEQGANVSLIARRPSELDPRLQGLPLAVADLSQRAELTAAMASLTKETAVDGIINCAGVVAFGQTDELSDDVTRQLFEVNALGVMNLISVAGNSLLPDGFLASFTGVAADLVLPGMGAYCASKAAAKAALAVAARELRRKKIRVLDIRAPHTETGLVSRALEGTAPKMPEGLDPNFVVHRVLQAIAMGEKDLPAEAFTTR
jgi:cyclic-di-GMP-binding biofilm dispersal mediator protein